MTIMRAVRLCPSLFFLILIQAATFIEGGESNQQPKYGSDWSRLLQVIVFAERTSYLDGDDVTFDVLERESADFPVEFSRILNRGLDRSPEELTRLGLPPRVHLDDLFTFELTEKRLTSQKPIKRRNHFSELEYFIIVENWAEDSYDVTLRGKVRKNGFKGVKAHLSRHKTTILKISDVDILYFALTPLDAVDFGVGMARAGEEGLQLPVPIKQTIPPLPEELTRRKVTGRSSSWVVFILIVQKSGLIDPEKYILAESPHAAFAMKPLTKLLQEWRLRPAEMGGEPTDSVIPVELKFNLN